MRASRPLEDFDTLWAATRDPRDPAADIALLVTYAPVLERQRVQAILLDLKAIARRYARWASRRQLTAQEQSALQEELFEVGVLTRTPVARDVQDRRDIEVFMKDLFRQSFAMTLTRRGLRRFGGIDVKVPPGARLYLDGVTIGSVEAPLTKVRSVVAGPRELRVEHPEFLPVEQAVVVEAGTVVPFKPTLIATPNQGAVLTRDILLWTGVATVAGGIAVTVATLLTPEEEEGMCLGEDVPGCPSNRRFKALGPFLGLPLGYALAGAGVTWTLATLLNDDDQSHPWWEFLAGVVIAGAAYGISAAVNPAAPVFAEAERN